jgi:hypothetical protein
MKIENSFDKRTGARRTPGTTKDTKRCYLQMPYVIVREKLSPGVALIRLKGFHPIVYF